MTARVISIHDAKLKTVSVGIKAMTISDRQVTLAVFRQLFEEDLIGRDGTLNGLPWGIVNYHPASDALQELNALLNKICPTPELLKTFSAEITAELERRARWIKTTQELASLPQLFVAV